MKEQDNKENVNMPYSEYYRLKHEMADAIDEGIHARREAYVQDLKSKQDTIYKHILQIDTLIEAAKESAACLHRLNDIENQWWYKMFCPKNLRNSKSQ